MIRVVQTKRVCLISKDPTIFKGELLNGGSLFYLVHKLNGFYNGKEAINMTFLGIGLIILGVILIIKDKK